MNTIGKRQALSTTVSVGALALCLGGMLVTGLASTAIPAPTTTPATVPHRPAPHPATTTAPSTAAVATRVTEREKRKQEDIDRVMKFFARTQPDAYEQAKTLRTSDPANFERLIMRTLPTVNSLEEMRLKKPELFELSMLDLELGYRSLRLAHDLKRTDLPETERKLMTDQLKATVAAEFDVQQKIQQFEINELRSKVKDLDNTVNARAAGKDSIMQKRMDDLTQGVPRLEW